MAKIWFGYQGDKSLRGDPFAVRLLRRCIEAEGLTTHNWDCVVGVPSNLAIENPALDALQKPIAVIFEVDTADLVGSKGRQSAYYIAPLRPENVQSKLSEAKSADTGRASNANAQWFS